MIKNFPHDFSFLKRIYYRLGISIGSIKFKKVKFSFSKDRLNAIRVMKRGDIILLGESKTLYSAVMKEPFTHTAIYLGLGGFISASVNGVRISPYRKLFAGIENIIILRIRKDFNAKHRIIRSVIHFAKSKIGSPYNFDFVKSNKYFFCSQLINEAFLNAGYPTGLDSFRRKKKSRAISRFFHKQASAALHPEDLVKGNFDIVFISKTLKIGKNGHVYHG